MQKLPLKSVTLVREALRLQAVPQKILVQQRFFKMCPGAYAEHEQFLGIMVPILRKLARKFADKLGFDELANLLNSSFHEERLLALLILVRQYQQEPSNRGAIFQFYLAQLKQINNWDLVDLSAPYIVGATWYSFGWKELPELCRRENFWQRRVAVVATWFLIRKGEFQPTLMAVTELLNDHERLIHKACGWMLREIGKRSEVTLAQFLTKYADKMPRLMLRAALERSSAELKRRYIGK